ncbi:GntR family transcriptional regulator, LSA1692 subfamily [Vagococcus sp. JNUCC 83]
MKEKKNTETVYISIAEEIERRIREGVYVSSQKLPSEYDLSDEFACSRLTIRKAIDVLIQKNIIVKKRGKGSYVMSRQKIQSGRDGLQGFTEAAKSYGKTSDTCVISFEKVNELDKKIREKLELEQTDTVYELVRCRSLDNEPMTVEKIYISEKYVDGLAKEDFKESLFKLIEQKVEIAYSHQEVEAILVDEEMSTLLDIPVGNPLLLVNSITFSINATPILYDISYYRADRYTFKNTLIRGNN